MKPIPVAILVRVSTKKQETDRQIHELTTLATQKGWDVVEVIKEEGITGTSKKRPGLARAMEMADAKLIQKVVVHEISRVARKNSVAHTFLDHLTDAGVSLYWHAQSCETLLPNGKPNPAASLMFAFLSENARNETDVLGERIRSGLEEARRKGKILGRPKGTCPTTAETLSKHANVVKLLKAGHSVRNASKITGHSTTTIQKIRRLMGLATPRPAYLPSAEEI